MPQDMTPPKSLASLLGQPQKHIHYSYIKKLTKKGLQLKQIADHLGVSANLLSIVLNGHRPASRSLEPKLEKFVQQTKEYQKKERNIERKLNGSR